MDSNIVTLLLFLGGWVLGTIIWFSWQARTSMSDYKLETLDDRLKYLDNEVRGAIRREFTLYRQNITNGEPTLKGRVDMIEKHLGIQVVVKPAKPEELIVIEKKG